MTSPTDSRRTDSRRTDSRRTDSRRTGKCPACGKATSADHRPFCGQGCRDRDLLQWLGDGYRLPGPAMPSDDDGDEQ